MLFPMQKTEVLDIDDADLPALLSRAAIDIDNLLAGRHEDFETMNRLSSLIYHSLKIDSVGKAVSKMSWLTERAVWRALHDITGVVDIHGMLIELRDMGDILRRHDSSKEWEELETAKVFCLKSSYYLIAYDMIGRSGVYMF